MAVDLNDTTIKSYSNEIENEKDQIAVFIHLIMLRAGFDSYDSGAQISDKSCIKQTKGSLYNKLFYKRTKIDFKSKEQLTYDLKSSLIVLLLQSGSNVEITAKYEKFQSGFIKIHLKEFFYEPHFYVKKRTCLDTAIAQLETDFLNNVLNPFRFFIKYNELESLDLDSNYINGLRELPVELVLRLAVNYLDMNTIVALFSTSKYFNRLFNSDLNTDSSVWLRLIKRDFKSECYSLHIDNSTTGINYRSKYVELYYKRKLFNKKYN